MQAAKLWLRICLRVALILFFIVLASLPTARPAAAKEPDSYIVNFLPNNFFRLCVGDSHTYAFMVKWVETEDPDPVQFDGNGLPILPPLHVYKVKVTATNGTVEPSEFPILQPSQVFRFKYTAQSEGQESIQVTITDGATGQGSKILQVLGQCDYKLDFFAKQVETVETGGFDVVFQGRGDFSLDRTAADSSSIKGNGTDQAALGIWAEITGLFACQMDPLRDDSTFKVEGTLRPDYGFMTVSLYFDPFTFPGNMHFDCAAVGLGNVTMDVPVGEQTGDANSLNMVGLTFPITGGSDYFDFGKSQGVVVVTMKK